jgi:putative ATP-binding cassette transporter
MTDQQVPINGLTWARFVRGVRNFAASEVGWKAGKLFAGLIAMLLGINALNVVNSYVGRDFMTAIANRDTDEFIWQAMVYVGVFAASTVVAVIYRFTEESLGLLWRRWLTRQFVVRYLDRRTYYRLDEVSKVENPDQRIADDVRAFSVTTLSFVLMLLNGSLTVVMFSGVLWSISPLLFMVSVVYAAGGSYLTIAWGRSLIALNYNQLDKEADFRSALIHVRENAESVALAHREVHLRDRILRRLDELTANFLKIIAVNRNLGFFTTGYNYLIQIIPALVVAPLYIRGDVEFGVITQAAMAFAHLQGAFSLIVTQFQSISSFAAVIARLGSLAEAIEQAHVTKGSAIEIREEDDRLVYEGLTLRSPEDGRLLVENLSISVPYGTRLSVLGPDETVTLALFRATAGIWNAGEGRIIRPQRDRLLFLPERPYIPPGTLREFLLQDGQKITVSDERLLSLLRTLDLAPVIARAGGLDVEQDWDDVLSLGEQQLLAFASLLISGPRFVFLDRISTALSPEQVDKILQTLAKHAISYVTIGEAGGRSEYYDAVLELKGDGRWKWKSVETEPVVEVRAQRVHESH